MRIFKNAWSDKFARRAQITENTTPVTVKGTRNRLEKALDEKELPIALAFGR